MQEQDFDREDDYPAEGQWAEGQVAPGTQPESQTGPVGPTIPDHPSDTEPSQLPDIEPLVLDQKEVHFNQTRNHSTAIADTEQDILSLVRENPEALLKILDHYNDVIGKMTNGETTTRIKDTTWLDALINGMAHIQLGTVPTEATERTGSEWHQGVVNVDGDPKSTIRSGRPSQRLDRNRKTSKDELLAYLSKRSGQGGFYDTMLPHAGIWVRLRAPTLTEIVALQTELANVKLRLGAESKGMAFSNAGAVMLDAITTLALNCVVASNRKFLTPTDFEPELSIYDEVLLHHGLATAMYPDGFNYSVPCVADPNTCTHIEKFKMNMSSIVWFDNLAFTQDQRKHLAKRFTPSSDEEFKAYRDAFTHTQKKVFWFGDVGVRLAVPSIEQRRKAGAQWMQSVIEMSQGTFNEAPHGQQRQKYIDKLAAATTAMQYAHWVDAIYDRMDDPENFEDQFVTDDPEIIQEYLANSLSQPDVAEKFFEAVHEYTNSSLLGIVAVPNWKCPVCESEQGKAHNERFPHLVPLDMVGVFFTLARQKASHLDT